MKRGKEILDLINQASMYFELREFLVILDKCKSISEAFIDEVSMWISLDDIETLELAYRCSQLSQIKRPHTKKLIQATVSQVKRGPDGLGDAQMGRIPEKT